MLAGRVTEGLFRIYAYSCENAHHRRISQATRWSYFSLGWIYLFRCVRGCHSQGARRTVSVLVSYLDLVCVALFSCLVPTLVLADPGVLSLRNISWGRRFPFQGVSLGATPVFWSLLVRVCLHLSFRQHTCLILFFSVSSSSLLHTLFLLSLLPSFFFFF